MMIRNLLQTGLILTTFGIHSAYASQTVAHPAIVGGTEASENDPGVSSTVMLYAAVSENGQTGTAICSASLIAKNILITAAHCVAEDINNPVKPSDMRAIFALTLPQGVVFGETLPSNITDPSALRIASYQVASGWKGAKNGEVAGVDAADLAILLLQDPIPPGYAPAPLLPANVSLSEGEPTILEGYGITSSRDTHGRSAGTLRTVTVEISGAVGQTEESVDMSHRKGMCSGDSGGPAFVEYHGQLALWGVTSRSDEGCTGQGIYTQIDAHLDWVTQAIQSLEQQG